MLAVVLLDAQEITTTSVARESFVPVLTVLQIALLAATIGAFAFMLSSLCATLKLTMFVGARRATRRRRMRRRTSLTTAPGARKMAPGVRPSGPARDFLCTPLPGRVGA